MRESFTGRVSSVTAIPGRPDMLLVDMTPKRPSYAGRFHFSSGEGTRLTADGVEVDAAGLFAWLLRTPDAEVTVNPLPERYDLSIVTEFKTAGS